MMHYFGLCVDWGTGTSYLSPRAKDLSPRAKS
jgi:hypothetical protein